MEPLQPQQSDQKVAILYLALLPQLAAAVVVVLPMRQTVEVVGQAVVQAHGLRGQPQALVILQAHRHLKAQTVAHRLLTRQITAAVVVVVPLLLALMEPAQVAAMVVTAPHRQFLAHL